MPDPHGPDVHGPVVHGPGSHQLGVSVDQLQAELCCLMTRYAAAPSGPAATAVVDQLTALCRHPHIALMPCQARVYVRLLGEWRVRLPFRAGQATPPRSA
jgi:hypothetical protein